MRRTIYIFTLVFLTAFIWMQLYSAQFLEYDDNFGQLLATFFVSIAFLLSGIVLFIMKNGLVRNNLIVTAIFLIVNSPFTIYFLVMNYETSFGAALNIG